MLRHQQHYFQHQWAILENRRSSLKQHAPTHRLQQLNMQYDNLYARLEHTIKKQFEIFYQRLSTPARALDTVSPLATLDRGYSITRRTKDNKILTSADDVGIGEEIETRLAKGILHSRVERIKKKNVQ